MHVVTKSELAEYQDVTDLQLQRTPSRRSFAIRAISVSTPVLSTSDLSFAGFRLRFPSGAILERAQPSSYDVNTCVLRLTRPRRPPLLFEVMDHALLAVCNDLLPPGCAPLAEFVDASRALLLLAPA